MPYVDQVIYHVLNFADVRMRSLMNLFRYKLCYVVSIYVSCYALLSVSFFSILKALSKIWATHHDDAHLRFLAFLGMTLGLGTPLCDDY